MSSPRRRIHPDLLAAIVLALLPVPVAAQGRDLGELTFSIPIGSGGNTVLVMRIDVPDLIDGDLPSAAVPLHARWREARGLLADAHRRRAAVSDAAERARITSTLTVLERALVAARSALVASLDGSIDTLSLASLLRLGMLRHEVADEAFLVELDAFEACTAVAAADCPEPHVDDSAALAVWARVTGDDVSAAYALYERAESLEQAGDVAQAARLLEAALAIDALPPALDAAASLLLGAVAPLDDVASVARTYGRCAALSVPDLSQPCALLAARGLLALAREDDALAALEPLLAPSAELRTEGEEVAALALLRLGAGAAAHLPSTLPPSVRAHVLDLAATLSLERGLITWGIEALVAAQALEADAERVVRIAALEDTRASRPDTPEAWLGRSMRFCVGPRRAIGGTFTVRWRFSARGASAISVTIGTDPMSILRAFGRCLREHAPPPESVMSGSYSAHVRLTTE